MNIKRNLKDSEIKETISNWNKLQNRITEFSESDLERAIKIEQSSNKRIHIVLRLHQRLSKLRNDRERRKIIGEMN